MADRLPTRRQILQVFESRPRVHLRELAEELDVPKRDFHALQAIVDGLVLDGTLEERPGNKFALVEPKSKRPSKRPATDGAARPGEGLLDARPSRASSSEREGTLSVNPRGFGFVSSPELPGGDVFIGPDSLGGAMHGDRVLIRVLGRNARGLEGEVVRIVERGVRRVAGILHRKGRSAWLEPDDTRLPRPIVLTSAFDTEGSAGNSGNDGDAAIVSITRYPVYLGEAPEGRLEIVLGRPGELGVETAKILAMAQVEELHSERAVAEAEAFGSEVPRGMLEGREDLTALPLPTIDPEDARDHDDAVWVERDADGGYVAWIAIADVSSYVLKETAIDKEASTRGFSIYLPDRAIPMLPRALSSNLCSLLPYQIRLCLCVEVHLDASGKVTRSRVFRAFMRSAAKLTYGGVARTLGLTDIPPRSEEAESLRDGLRVAYELSRILRGRRMKRGALDFELPEAKILFDPDTRAIADIQRRTQDPGMKKAYQLVEELMLLANETVAKWLVDRESPAIFRVHHPPDETKLERFCTLCESLGIEFDPEDAKDPKALSSFIHQLANHPLASVLHMLLLRSMKQAAYDVQNLGHFGLASKAYLHFTSPIRRYPDLLVHRRVHQLLAGKSAALSPSEAEHLKLSAMACSAQERKVMEVEREVLDVHRCWFMRDHVGEVYGGTVTGVVGSGLYVALDAPFVDVLVRLEDLGGPGYVLDDDGLFVYNSRKGTRWGLGDRMLVRILDVSMVRRAILGRRLDREFDEGVPESPDLPGYSVEGAVVAPRRRPSRSPSQTGRALPSRKRSETSAKTPQRANTGKTGQAGKTAKAGKAGKTTKATKGASVRGTKASPKTKSRKVSKGRKSR